MKERQPISFIPQLFLRFRADKDPKKGSPDHSPYEDELNSMRQFYEKNYSEIRKIIKEKKIDDCLYPGMYLDLTLPCFLGIKNCVGVDPAYHPITNKRKVRVAKGEEAWQVNPLQLKAVLEALGKIIKEEYEVEGHPILDLILSKKGVKKVKYPSINYTFINDDLANFLRKEKRQYPFIILKRTFPKIEGWVLIISSLSNDGYLLTSGCGNPFYGSETISGVDIANTPLPLYFPSSLLGLNLILETPDKMYFYKKN